MTPLFACFPVCMTLSAIGLIAVGILAYEWMRRTPTTELPANDEKQSAFATGGPPPVWAMVVFVIAIAVSMLFFAWLWPE